MPTKICSGKITATQHFTHRYFCCKVCAWCFWRKMGTSPWDTSRGNLPLQNQDFSRPNCQFHSRKTLARRWPKLGFEANPVVFIVFSVQPPANLDLLVWWLENMKNILPNGCSMVIYHGHHLEQTQAKGYDDSKHHHPRPASFSPKTNLSEGWVRSTWLGFRWGLVIAIEPQKKISEKTLGV